MNSFRAYFKIARRYSGISFMYLGIFFGIVILLVMNSGKNSPETFESTKVNIAVYDKDNSDFSRALYQYLEATQSIIELKDDKDVWKDYMYMHEVEYILVIPEDFGSQAENGSAEKSLIGYQTPGSKYSMFVEMEINNFLKIFHTYTELGNNPTEAYRLTKETLEQNAGVVMKKAKEETPYSLYFRYIAYILPAMLLLSITPCINAFNREEIQRRIFCGKTGYTERNIQVTLAAVVHSMLFSVVLVFAAMLFYKNISSTQLFLFLCNVLMHTLTCLGLCFAFSRFLPNDNVRSMVANVYSLAAAFLCGIFVDRIYLPDSVLAIGHAFPAYWYLNLNEIVNNWSGSGEQMGIFMTSVLMQLGFTAAFLCFGFVAGKKIKK